MKLTSIFSTAAIMLLASVPAMAQKTMDDMQYLTRECHNSYYCQ